LDKNTKKIKLFWWSEVYFANKKKENYGDLIGKYLVERISKKKVIWVHPKKQRFWNKFQTVYFTAGSILTHIHGKCIVWGSGIISKEYRIEKAVFLAVRGPQSRKLLIEQGHNIPEVYGDPALLLPKFYLANKNKKYHLGVIPHFVDYQFVCEQYKNVDDVLVINLMTNDIEAVTNLILSCEKIISSSLHGIIVSHAYQIPAVWVEFSKKIFGDGIKYQDYLESVELEMYSPLFLNSPITNEQLYFLFNKDNILPKEEVINDIQTKLMKVCPFN
jgi:pyruvyltransferase